MTRRAVVATTSGSVLEWYDFTLYGFLAPILGQAFFPSDNHVASLLSAFAVLAVGYAARPIGSILFGYVGDKIGRKTAMMISVALMGAGSFLIAILPSAEQIGIAAAVIFVIIRIVQGISVAGEYSSSGVLLIEQTPPGIKGWVGGWIAFAMMIGCMLGSGVPALLGMVISEAQLQAWGWRIPFLLGSGVAVFCLVIRSTLVETAVFDQTGDKVVQPVRLAFRQHTGLILQMIILLIPTAIIYFVIFVYAASYLTGQMSFTTAQAMDITTINLFVISIVGLLAGLLSDRIGLRAVFLIGAFGTLIVAWPSWQLMHSENLTFVFLGQMGFSIFNAVGWGLSVVTLVQIAPRLIRCSTVAIGYNTCMALFGGTTPMVVTYLVNRTGDDFAPVIYIIVATLISIPVIWRLPRLLEKAKTL